jgi:polyhydroxyalkanoate synthesis regulator phasin
MEMVDDDKRDDGADEAHGDEQAGEETFASRVQRAWKESVGTYATDEGQTRNLLQRLVEFGSLSQKEAKDAFADMQHRIKENRRELDRRVDESLKRATARLTIPSPSEIEDLRARVDELEERVKDAEAGRG